MLTGRPKEAADAFRRALVTNPDKVDALLGLGTAAEQLGDQAAAEDAFRRAIAIQPSFAVYNQLGYIRSDRSRWADAAAMFRKASELAPDSYRALSNLGGVSALDCDFTTALPAFQRALKIRPNDPSTTSNLGLALLWTGRVPEAVASLGAAALGAPGDFEVWGAYGDALAESGAKEKAAAAYEKSIVLAREALKLNPRDAAAHAVLGASLARTGRLDEGTREIEAALAINGEEAMALADAALIAALRNRPAEALAWLKKAVDAGYCPQILARRPEFAALRESPEFKSIIAAPRNAAGS